MIWRLRSAELSLDIPRIMGIINMTPDSFSDGGMLASASAAIGHGLALVEAGAAIVDVGGESSRPGARGVDVADELGRILPVVVGLVDAGVLVSVDTTKPEVAQAACQEGAVVINDISGMADPAMRSIAIEHGAGVVVMHKKGDPQTMQDNPVYGDVVTEVRDYLDQSAQRLVDEGLSEHSIVVDPGIGFGKTIEHNLELLDRLGELGSGRPLMIGVSRKGFLGRILDLPDPGDRDRASATLAALAVERGVRLVRAHDVRATLEAVRLAWAIVQGRT